MKFDIFVLPFLLGFTFAGVFLSLRIALWIYKLDKNEKSNLRKHIFSHSVVGSLKEIFKEVLIHCRIYKTNPLLGYMHMSLAFGWFMLILLGNLQVKFFSPDPINPPFYPIFLKFFEPVPPAFKFDKIFNFLMDFFLLIVLSGVFLAWLKRFRKKAFGLKQVTIHNRGDKLALAALWLIFPARLLAESFSSGIYNNGSFLTGSLGHLFASFLPVNAFLYPAWWIYSLALGTFLFALPFSRYMHIPVEPFLILLRNAGIKDNKQIGTFSKAEINACSRCGICIDSCQLSSVLGINNIQPTYFIRDIRYKTLQNDTTENCLMCGRCNISCPVGIDNTGMRLSRRIIQNNYLWNDYLNFSTNVPGKTDVLYFAGCMTQLTPSVKKSMANILDFSGISWDFLDKEGTICCGRPLMLAGQLESARILIDKNISLIKSSGAKTLVTSCPVCFKIFRDDYNLKIEVLHHSQFLLRLLEEGKIKIQKSSDNVIYHDPCELGRNSGVFLEPRKVINYAAELMQTGYEKEKSLCCGGSLGNFHLSESNKKNLAIDAIGKMGIHDADMLITACPLCKKSFDKVTEKPVLDIAQLVSKNLIKRTVQEPKIFARRQETVAYAK